MSDIPVDHADRLNLREQIARIDRQRGEAQKLNAERDKLAAEQIKLVAEALKLSAEEAKLRRDRALSPILAVAALGGVIGGVAAFLVSQLPAILRAAGLR